MADIIGAIREMAALVSIDFLSVVMIVGAAGHGCWN